MGGSGKNGRETHRRGVVRGCGCASLRALPLPPLGLGFGCASRLIVAALARRRRGLRALLLPPLDFGCASRLNVAALARRRRGLSVAAPAAAPATVPRAASAPGLVFSAFVTSCCFFFIILLFRRRFVFLGSAAARNAVTFFIDCSTSTFV